MMILDKQGREVDVNEKPGNSKISPYDRDCIYQRFVELFPSLEERRGILRESPNRDVRRRATELFARQSQLYEISASRINAFVSEAVATEAGVLPKSERWDWWVGCSIPNSSSATSASLR